MCKRNQLKFENLIDESPKLFDVELRLLVFLIIACRPSLVRPNCAPKSNRLVFPSSLRLAATDSQTNLSQIRSPQFGRRK